MHYAAILGVTISDVLMMQTLIYFRCQLNLNRLYHHVDIHAEFQEFLWFQWQGEYIVFTVLPFGLFIACYVFTKVLGPLVKFWRGNVIKVVLYIDDGIIISADEKAEVSNIQLIKSSLAAAGLVINDEKSALECSHIGKWLKFNIDLAIGELSVPKEKLQQLITMLSGALDRSNIQPKVLASLVGKIISMSLGIGPITRLHTRSLYALLNSRLSWCTKLQVRPAAKEELILDNLEHYNRHKFWNAPSAVRVVFSDARSTGYGGFLWNMCNM